MKFTKLRDLIQGGKIVDLLKKWLNVFLAFLLTFSLFAPAAVQAVETKGNSYTSTENEMVVNDNNESLTDPTISTTQDTVIIEETETDVKTNDVISETEEVGCLPIEIRIESWLETLIPLQTICVETFDSDEYGLEEETPVVGHAFLQAIEKAENSKITLDDFENGSNGTIFIERIGDYGSFTMESGLDGWLYTKNLTWAPEGMSSEPLEVGDRIDIYYAANYLETVFTELSVDTAKVSTDENVTFTLNEIDINTGVATNSVEGATIYINGKATDYKTDSDGKAFISFSEEGIYEITANRYESDPSDLTYNNNIIRPVSVKVEVKEDKKVNIPINKIELSESSPITLHVGENLQLTATVLPENTTEDKAILWSSSDNDIIKVDNGKITAIATGSATISAKAGDVVTTITVKVIQDSNETTPTISEAINTASSYLASISAEPKFGSEWSILTLARSNYSIPNDYYETYYNNVVSELQLKNGELTRNTYTEYSRLIIALSSIGKDSRDVGGYNLIEKLADFNKVTRQGINGAIFALIAIDTFGYEIPQIDDIEVQATRENLINYILDKEIKRGEPDAGGFALSGKTPDPDITAMAIQALVPYQNQPDVKAVIDRAIVKLADMQLNNGGYESWGTENVQSAAQVLVALSTLGIDATKDERFVQENGSTIVTAILEYYTADGGFAHPKDGPTNGMATQQAAYALTAYNRLLNGQNALYNMSDVKPSDFNNSEEEPTENPNPGNGNDTDDDVPSNPNPGGSSPQPIEKVKLSIIISSSNKPLPTTEIEVKNGDTVYEVLKRATKKYDIELSARNTDMGVYVEGIAGLYEFDKGPKSGWMYRVNGDFPNISASKFKVKPGDRIEWLYTTDLGNDIGGGFDDSKTNPGNNGSSGGGGSGSGGGSKTPEEQNETDPHESTITVKNQNGETKVQLTLSDWIVKTQNLKGGNLIITDETGTKIEVPTSLDILSLPSDSTIVIGAKHTAVNDAVAFIVELEVKHRNSTPESIKTGKEYLKVTTPISDLPKGAVILQIEDGEYRAVPHKIENGQVIILTKSGGTFVVRTDDVTFSDLTNSPYKEEVEFLAKRGIVAGREDGTFSPNEPITRAHFAALISNALGLYAENSGQFVDTEEKWYEQDIQALYEAGITAGTSKTTFSPEDKITRQQAAALMAKVLEYVSFKSETTSELAFKDSDQVYESFAESISLLNSLGIMNGKADGTFDPQGELTRGQMAKILTRTLKIGDLM